MDGDGEGVRSLLAERLTRNMCMQIQSMPCALHINCIFVDHAHPTGAAGAGSVVALKESAGGCRHAGKDLV